MSETVIKVENLSKQYRLGLVGVTTISEDLKRYWAKFQGKEDPSLKIGHTNKLNTKITTQNSKHKIPDYVWALKDINFEVKQGEVLGIIGKNGAGKSTLLKILSKVTAPSTGNIKIKGRIASLLEVGTGFHAELTGRENIFLNGAILGMTKTEIKSKLDEIIDFSGVERYIDTPVKRYSSGMYVRLAFAVAAHLEPEILIVDEVLAVGDAEFQKKCLGKMGDVAKGGRTVLFVSHNMVSITSLCDRTILLESGTVSKDGITSNVINNYLENSSNKQSYLISNLKIGNDLFVIKDFSFFQNSLYKNELIQGESFGLSFILYNDSEYQCELIFNIEIKSMQGEPVTCFGNQFQNYSIFVDSNKSSKIKMEFNQLLLKKGTYYISLYFMIKYNKEVNYKYVEDAVKLDVLEPSPLFFTNKNRTWKSFPLQLQHGYISLEINNIVVE